MQKRSKTQNEVITYEFDFLHTLETIWHPNEIKSATQYVRPTIGNGFEYECTSGGQTDADEPDWPETIGETVEDGSVQWTCRDFASNATDSIQTKLVTSDAGITVDSDTIQGTRIDVQLSGGTPGKAYTVRAKAITTAGQEYEEILRLSITE